MNLDTNNQTEVTPSVLKTLNLRNTWLELVEPTKGEVECVSDKIGVAQNFLDLPASDGLVNLRLEDDFTVVNFVIIEDIIASKEVHPIVMILCKDFLVTVEKKADQHIIDLVKKRMSKTKIDPPSQVIYFIIDEIVSSHFVQLEKIEELTSTLEEQVLEKTSAEILKNIFILKSNLIALNKTLWYERSLVFNLKKCSETYMPAKMRPLFDATHEDLTRQIDIVETYREILSDAINEHLSATSNKINFSIKSLTVVIFYLTIITTLTSFPNTVATFFGISQFGNADPLIIFIAITLSILLPLFWLWQKRWLKYET